MSTWEFGKAGAGRKDDLMVKARLRTGALALIASPAIDFHYDLICSVLVYPFLKFPISCGLLRGLIC